MSINVGTLHYTVEVLSSGAKKAIAEFAKSTKTAEDRIKQLDVHSKFSFSNISKSTKTIAKGLGILTTAIGTVGGAFQAIAIKQGADFQQRISDISTLIDGSQKDFKDLGDQILGITDRVPVEGSVLSASLYDVVSAGILGTNNQLKVLEESSKLGIAGLGSTASAVDLMTSALNAFQIESDKSDEVSNILFKTVKGGKTTIDQLAQSFGQVAPIAKATKVRFDELQAATAALTTSGLKTSVAQTQLKALFTDLNREGTKLSKAFKSIGVESVSASIQQDGFVETLKKLKDEAKLSDVEFSNLFGSVEAAGAALALTGAQSIKFKDILADMRNGTDAITGAFDKQKSTFNNTYQLLKNKVNKIFTQFGLEVLPAVTEALNDFSQFIDDNQESIDDLIRGFGEVAQVLASTLVSAFKFTVQAGGEVINVIKGLSDAFNQLAAVLVGAGVYLTLTNLPLIFASLKVAVAGLSAGLVKVVVGIKAIGASIAAVTALNVVFAAIAITVGVLTYKYLELKKQIQDQIESIDQNISKNQELKDSFSELGESLGSTFDEAIEARKEFLSISTQIQQEFKNEAELRGELKEIFLGANEDEINAIYDKIDTLQEEQRQASQIAREKIEEVISTEGEIFQNLMQFAQLRKKLGEREFAEQVKIIKLRGGVTDELNQKILKGEIQLNEAKLRIIKAFGISNIEIISEIAKLDANTAKKRLKIAKELGLKSSKLIQELLRFQQSASDEEVEVYVDGLLRKQKATASFDRNLRKLLKPKIQKIFIALEGAQEGSPFSNFFGKIKQLADPNTYAPILEGLSQVSTLSKSFQAELDTIDTDVESALNNITLGAEESISKISEAGAGGGRSVSDALEKTAEETESFQDRINKALKEGSEEIAEKLEDTFGAAESAIKQFSQSIKEETDKMQAEINKTTKQITELQGTFDTFKERSAKLIIKAQEDEKKLIEEIAKEEERIKQKNEELKKQNAEIQEQNKKTIESGEAKLKELKKEIDVTDRLMKLQDELQQARAVIVTGEDLEGQVDLVKELENARVEASLNPLELLRKEFEEKTGFNVQSIQEEIARLEQVRLELEENLNQRLELYETFFTDVENADGSFTRLYLKRVKERENVTVESINALIKKYNDLERTQQRINKRISFPTESLNDRNEKIRGFSKGGFTGSGVGVVHPNEWVAPSWMVGQLRGVFDQLESRRLGGSRVPVSSSVNNNRNFNVTVNNNTPDEANLFRNMHYMRWMSRYA